MNIHRGRCPEGEIRESWLFLYHMSRDIYASTTLTLTPHLRLSCFLLYRSCTLLLLSYLTCHTVLHCDSTQHDVSNRPYPPRRRRQGLRVHILPRVDHRRRRVWNCNGLPPSTGLGLRSVSRLREEIWSGRDMALKSIPGDCLRRVSPALFLSDLQAKHLLIREADRH